MKTWDLFVDGKRVPAAQSVTVRNPWDQGAVAEVGMADSAQLDAAIAAAERAWKTWKHSSRWQRSKVIGAHWWRGSRSGVTSWWTPSSREGGKPRQYAAVEVDRCITTFTTGADGGTAVARRGGAIDTEQRTEGYFAVVVRKPLGVIGGISPFNFPLNLVAHKVAPSIASGNAMVLKPASQTPILSICWPTLRTKGGPAAGRAERRPVYPQRGRAARHRPRHSGC